MRFPLPDYDSCSFCDDLAGTRECAFVTRSELAAVLIDERQYERGAMLVIPLQHRESVLDIAQEEIEGVYHLAQRVARAATLAFGALGVNVYQNNGSKAGQHEPHFHVHVVPRYESSEPGRIFRQGDYDIVSLTRQREIATMLRAHL